MVWNPDKEAFWQYLLAWFLNLLSGRFTAAGREEAVQEQQVAAKKLEEDYAKNDSDDRTLDDAVGGLRNRAARRRKPVPGPG